VIATKERATRRADLDWLRALAILTVFFYHSAKFFDQADWSVKNSTTCLAVSQ
jgi:glucans biosynthesis protein C